MNTNNKTLQPGDLVKILDIQFFPGTGDAYSAVDRDIDDDWEGIERYIGTIGEVIACDVEYIRDNEYIKTGKCVAVKFEDTLVAQWWPIESRHLEVIFTV